MTVLYKITRRVEWQDAVRKGVFSGSTLDLKDGYIHLSTAEQVRETARLYFARQTDLVLVAIPESAVAGHLKWEASRGGKLFPHVFAPLTPATCLWVVPLPWTGAAHDFPSEVK